MRPLVCSQCFGISQLASQKCPAGVPVSASPAAGQPGATWCYWDLCSSPCLLLDSFQLRCEGGGVLWSSARISFGFVLLGEAGVTLSMSLKCEPDLVNLGFLWGFVKNRAPLERRLLPSEIGAGVIGSLPCVCWCLAADHEEAPGLARPWNFHSWLSKER